ncbi:MAG: CBS domain-containing protein, partial [Ferruginibacter sp.]
DIVINTTVAQEACPNNLAPTTSTTAQMVMGDALAICLMEAKNFNTGDFARFHPGGVLGKKLYLRVQDLLPGQGKPWVKMDAAIKEVIVEITHKRLGAVAVMDSNEHIAGIITDGDIRRMLEKHDSFKALKAADIMSLDPKKIDADAMAAEAMETMQQYKISQLLVIKDGTYVGIIHVHALVKEGIL